MIPHGLEEEHFLQAADQIDKEGVPVERRSVHYDLVLRSKTYPPKYIISLAAKFASGVDHPSNRFNAVEAVNYFRSRDYQITDRRKKTVHLAVVSENDDSAFPEGKEKYRIHRHIERNPKVANRRRKTGLQPPENFNAKYAPLTSRKCMGKLERALSKRIIPYLSLRYRKKQKPRFRISHWSARTAIACCTGDKSCIQ